MPAEPYAGHTCDLMLSELCPLQAGMKECCHLSKGQELLIAMCIEQVLFWERQAIPVESLR